MYKYQLENSSNTPFNSKKKYKCPACNKSGRFTLYIDIETKDYLNHSVGICDRSDSCGFQYTPKQYFLDNNINTPIQNYITPVKSIPTTTSYINQTIVKATLKAYSSNKLVTFLKSIFDTETVNNLVSLYRIGTSKSFGGGSTVFWQVDADEKIRSGKIILYNERTGKRTKKINWVHSLLKLKEFSLTQCFFGEHLINLNSKPIAIVESEKTAIISSIYFPNYNWLASGSMQNLNIKKFNSLKGRNIILFPDTSTNGTAFNLWLKRSEELKELGVNCIVNDILEKNANNDEKESGCDLADYLLKYPINEFRSLNQKKIVTHKDRTLSKMIKSNSLISNLIETFDLYIEIN